MVSLVGEKLMPTAYETKISSGAVSPITRARPSMTPVMMPPNAVGMTTLRMVFHFGTPSAYEASRSSIRHEFEHLLGRSEYHGQHQQYQGEGHRDGGAAQARRS